MVWALALRSGDPGFKTPSDHQSNLILVVPGLTSLLHLYTNSQLVCLQPVEFVVVDLFCRFICFIGPMGEWSIKYVCVHVCTGNMIISIIDSDKHCSCCNLSGGS